jgi:hypothetical protein
MWLVGVLATLAVGAMLTWAAWSNNLFFYDDSKLAYENQHFGFWGPTRTFIGLWGFYRIGYTMILAMVLWRKLGGTRLSGVFILSAILFYPFALEAVVWPATVPEYALGPFVLILGAVIALGPGEWAALYGGALMGSSLFLHEQLLVPLGILVFVLCIRDIVKRRLLLIGSAVPAGIAALLILLSFGRNERFSGPQGASLGNVIENIGYVFTDLGRSTPFGDFFWDPTGLEPPGVLMTGALGIGVVLLWLVGRQSAPPPTGYRFPLSAIGLGVVAFAGTILPIISTGIPWHTPRVMYMPAIALAFVLGGVVDGIERSTGSAFGRWVIIGAVMAWAAWGAMVLGAEASAFRGQLEVNDQRLDALIAAVEPPRDLTETSLLVVAGFPGTDIQRPIFGEHIVGITRGEMWARLGLRVYHPSPKPAFDFRAGFAGLCRHPEGQVDLLPEWVAEYGLSVPEDGASYLIWMDEAWHAQRGSETLAHLTQLEAILPGCPPT